MLQKLLLTPLVQQFVRFVGIGFLNTAVDYAIFNLFASLFDIHRGPKVALINSISFTIAVLHSFFWNKYWAFGKTEAGKGFLQQARQFVIAAIIGAVVIAAAIVGSGRSAGAGFYFILSLALLTLEFGMWKGFRLRRESVIETTHGQFMTFVFISLIGVFINSGIVVAITTYVDPVFGINQDLWANLAKVVATGITLIWNFSGYKIFVFK